MSNKKTPIIIGIVALVLIGMLFLFGGGNKRFNWWEHYRPNSKDPYGTFIVYELLKSYFPGHTFLVMKKSLAEDLPKEKTDANYVFIGSMMPLDSTQTDALLHFVERGNQAFIACAAMPYTLLDSISRKECLTFSFDEVYEEDTVGMEELPEDTLAENQVYEDSLYEDTLAEESVGYLEDHFLEDTLAWLNFAHPQLADSAGYASRFLFRNEPVSYTWECLHPDLFCENQTVFASLGTINDSLVNFAKATYGKGAFYLHTTPLAFTNLYLKQEQGLKYAGKTFSHLSPGDIYWDDIQFLSSGFGHNRSLNNGGPLKYVLSQPPLAWAWYILLAMAILYLAFRAKRRQRVIPVLEQNANTSLEFIGTIGRLYFLQNNHKQLALQKMRLFLGFVRERYNLPTRDLNEQFIKLLSTKSEVPEELIGKILRFHQNVSTSGFVSENALVDFHRLMEGFYQKCK